MHYQYFHNNVDGFFSPKGWNFVKNCYPEILSESEIERFGYYSGIVFTADNYIQKHKTIIKGFYECYIKTHTETPNKKDNTTEPTKEPKNESKKENNPPKPKY